MSHHHTHLAYPWNAPLPVIDPETFGRALPQKPTHYNGQSVTTSPKTFALRPGWMKKPWPS